MTYSLKTNTSQYHYPKWVSSVEKVKQINTNYEKQLWVSLLKTPGKTFFDIRVHVNNQPTFIGVFLTHDAALELITILDKFLAGDLTNDYGSET